MPVRVPLKPHKRIPPYPNYHAIPQNLHRRNRMRREYWRLQATRRITGGRLRRQITAQMRNILIGLHNAGWKLRGR